MNDLEERVAERMRASAQTVQVIRPPTTTIVERAARRRRRRAATRGAAGLTATVVMVGGAALLASRAGTEPAPSSVFTAPPAVTVPQGDTLDITNVIPAADEWARMTDNALTARSHHLLVATDTGLLVWGGTDGDATFTDGAYYDSGSRTWRNVPTAPLAGDRGDAVGVWTGTEIVVINGVTGNVKSAAFDPATFTWRALSDPPVDNAANGASQALFVDGTVVLFSVFEDGAAPQNQVAQLDLYHGSWAVVPSPPVPLIASVGLVEAGTEAVVVGQSSKPGTCNQLHVLGYTPSTGAWREFVADPVVDLADPVVVWTGSELFVGGGGSCTNGVAAPDLANRAALLDLTIGTWRSASPAPLGYYSSYRYPDMWTGSSVALLAPDGAPLLYNPTTDEWHQGPSIDVAQPPAPNQTPAVLLDGRIVVSSGQLTQKGELCCGPFRGTFAYAIPDGF